MSKLGIKYNTEISPKLIKKDPEEELWPKYFIPCLGFDLSSMSITRTEVPLKSVQISDINAWIESSNPFSPLEPLKSDASYKDQVTAIEKVIASFKRYFSKPFSLN